MHFNTATYFYLNFLTHKIQSLHREAVGIFLICRGNCTIYILAKYVFPFHTKPNTDKRSKWIQYEDTLQL